jgi:glycosyltransferase involved in cell wall biosynthesis
LHIVVATGAVAGSQWAHAINTFSMAGGFASLGHQVTIICTHPLLGRKSEKELIAQYRISEDIIWRQVPKLPPIPHLDRYWFAMAGLPLLRRLKPDVVFTRSYTFPASSCKLNIPTIAESHAHPGNRTISFRHFVKTTHNQSFKLLVTISERLAANFMEVGVPEGKLLVLPTGVDLEMFTPPSTLPPTPYQTPGPNVAFTGHLYDYNGISLIIEAAALMPDVSFHLVGGWPKDVERRRKEIESRDLKNVTLHGLRPHAGVPPFLWHADVLLLPLSARYPNSAWASPVKLGEYLASETPVIVSDVPAFRDWLTNEEVYFVEPDNGAALAEGIRKVLDDRNLANSLSQRGREKAEGISYQARAQTMLAALGI